MDAPQTEDGIFDATVACTPPATPDRNVEQDGLQHTMPTDLENKTNIVVGGRRGGEGQAQLDFSIATHIREPTVASKIPPSVARKG